MSMSWSNIFLILTVLIPLLFGMWGIMRSIKEEIRAFRGELKDDIQSLRSELKRDLRAMEERLSRWMDSLEKRTDTLQETVFFLFTGEKIDRISEPPPFSEEAKEG
ncbi:MAG: hypothetical protein S4CHLAM45_11110 [Chlamydiales bacterium]|nr:hypothetical protein [Chlamydiales bacterium]MCH9619603.1 hypothetical protein [Chlamydiales bacterium]MCH9623209.1 hypothetical protein [Chlamydiales bacterium]